jgi:citronellol/citronellal dehydrogenase
MECPGPSQQEDALVQFDGRVAVITGASRGIGKAIALRLAEEGCHVVVAAKTVEPHPTLPGTIGETAAEIEKLGRRALAVACDVRNDAQVEELARRTLDTFGRVDFVINNAGALWWMDMIQTPMKRFDLVMGVNARGAFAVTHAFLPAMIEARYGHVLMMSPPVVPEAAAHKIAYMISKFGMTLVAHGLAGEVQEHNVACNALWPATMVESLAVINFGLGDSSMWRKPEILSDATVAIFRREPASFTGHALIDEDFLREHEGVEDFSRYRCDPQVEPPRLDLGFDVRASVPGKG